MGVSRINCTNGGPSWIARYRKQSRSFAVSAHGEAEAKRLAEAAFAEYGPVNANGHAYQSRQPTKNFDLMTNFSLFWKTSRTTIKKYPYLVISFMPNDGVCSNKTIKQSLTKHGIKNSVVKLSKQLLDAGYPEMSESELINEVRGALRVSYAKHNFDLKLIPDFY